MISPYYRSKDRNFVLLQGDCTELLPMFEFKFDMIFADPPYFLSNGGMSVQSGRRVSVDKGEWDKVSVIGDTEDFGRRWLSACRDKLKDSGTIWICGTYHNIFSIGKILEETGFRVLNVITWVKTNPPPNLSCRFFTHSTEFIVWARKYKKVPHLYNYELLRKIAGGKQMKDVWELPAIAAWKKSCGKHPTQKPLSVLIRSVLASTAAGSWILDPFAGSSTTGIAANLVGRRYLGIEQETEYLEMSVHRKHEIENSDIATKMRDKIKDLSFFENDSRNMVSESYCAYPELPF